MSDEVQNYNAVSRVFHWSVGFLILGLLIVGFYMEGLEPPFKFKVYGWHKALGIAVIGLGVLRGVWKFSSASPKSLSAHKQWEKLLSKTIHIVLYFLIIAMPLSGWVMSSAGGYAISFFGLFEVPPIVGEDKGLSKFAGEVHGVLAYAFIVCIGLHIVGALKHHVIDKDATLNRMGGNLVLVALGLIALVAALFFPAQDLIGEMMGGDVVALEEEAHSDHDSHAH